MGIIIQFLFVCLCSFFQHCSNKQFQTLMCFAVKSVVNFYNKPFLCKKTKISKIQQIHDLNTKNRTLLLQCKYFKIIYNAQSVLCSFQTKKFKNMKFLILKYTEVLKQLLEQIFGSFQIKNIIKKNMRRDMHLLLWS